MVGLMYLNWWGREFQTEGTTQKKWMMSKCSGVHSYLVRGGVQLSWWRTRMKWIRHIQGLHQNEKVTKCGQLWQHSWLGSLWRRVKHGLLYELWGQVLMKIGRIRLYPHRISKAWLALGARPSLPLAKRFMMGIGTGHSSNILLLHSFSVYF